MTKPIPQREPMLALPAPKPITVKVGEWVKSIDYKKQIF